MASEDALSLLVPDNAPRTMQVGRRVFWRDILTLPNHSFRKPDQEDGSHRRGSIFVVDRIPEQNAEIFVKSAHQVEMA